MAPSSQINRRRFLRTTSAGALSFPFVLRAQKPSSLIRIAAIGCSRNSKGGPGRGSSIAAGFASLSNVEVATVCDVDERNLAPVAKEVVEKSGGKSPRTERDFRRLLEDKEIDAVTIATPDHWHTPAALLAIDAGKHVYVEKPCSHNAQEGEWLVAAARKHRKHVQHGTQRRSWPALREAVDRLRAGEIGRVLAAKAYYFNARPSIGRGKETAPPAWLDWSLWQGPAPERPFRDNFVHYNWHWFWHWGTGELGNNGVHMIDVCRWGLGVDFARRVTSAGDKVRYDDDQETPDTNVVTFDFGKSLSPDARTITWENRSWSAKTPNDPKADSIFYGEKGTLHVNGGAYTIFDPEGKEVAKGSGLAGDESHFQNFLDAIRGSAKLNAGIEEGHKSTLLTHFGNIAWRTAGAVAVDPQTGHLSPGQPKSQKLWGREYRPGWAPKVS
jgi:predicted dehydrogenase